MKHEDQMIVEYIDQLLDTSTRLVNAAYLAGRDAPDATPLDRGIADAYSKIHTLAHAINALVRLADDAADLIKAK